MHEKKRARGFAQTIRLTHEFLPYFKPYWRTMALDLFCASLTTLCDLVLPKIVQRITAGGTGTA